MNDRPLTGPCAEFELDLVELHDRALDPARASAVRLHLQTCNRCRSWLAAFAAVDRVLNDALPHPALAPDFDQRLRMRIDAIDKRQAHGRMRADVDRDYMRLIEALRREAGWRAVANALAAAAAGACVALVVRGPLTHAAAGLATLGERGKLAALVGLGFAVAMAAVAWSERRGMPLFPR